MRVSLFYDFLYSILLALVIPALFPALPLFFFFAPFLAKVCARRSHKTGVAAALVAGGVTDCLSAELAFGTHTLITLAATLILSALPLFFWEHRSVVRPFLTACWVAIACVLSWFALFLFSDADAPLSLLGRGLLLSPWIHALYAIFAFVLPSLFLEWVVVRRRMRSLSENAYY